MKSSRARIRAHQTDRLNTQFMTQHNICVYCGSGNGRNSEYVAAARQLGQDMAKADIGLVYGGGSLGLTCR